MQELRKTVHLDTYKSNYSRELEHWVRGTDPATNNAVTYRASVHVLPDGTCRSVEEQVKCLIDEAMDANLLGRAYSGWGSFA